MQNEWTKWKIKMMIMFWIVNIDNNMPWCANSKKNSAHQVCSMPINGSITIEPQKASKSLC